MSVLRREPPVPDDTDDVSFVAGAGGQIVIPPHHLPAPPPRECKCFACLGRGYYVGHRGEPPTRCGVCRGTGILLG